MDCKGTGLSLHWSVEHHIFQLPAVCRKLAGCRYVLFDLFWWFV